MIHNWLFRRRIGRELSDLTRLQHLILKQQTVILNHLGVDMSLHDDLLKAAQDARASVKRLAASKIEGEQRMQDVIAEIEAIKTEADQASADEAALGSSTGAGSGSGATSA